MTEPKTNVHSFRLPAGIWRRLQQVADDNDTTPSKLIVRAIIEYLNKLQR